MGRVPRPLREAQGRARGLRQGLRNGLHPRARLPALPLLRPDPKQRARLEEIQANLKLRLVEARKRGWLGDVEGLEISLAGAEQKLAVMQRLADTLKE